MFRFLYGENRLFSSVLKVRLVDLITSMDESSPEVDESEQWKLHKCVFNNDLQTLSELLKTSDSNLIDKKVKFSFSFSYRWFYWSIHYLNAWYHCHFVSWTSQDKHGNTPLHLATMLGRKGESNVWKFHCPIPHPPTSHFDIKNAITIKYKIFSFFTRRIDMSAAEKQRNGEREKHERMDGTRRSNFTRR